MKLEKLLRGVDIIEMSDNCPAEVIDIRYDSRAVCAGDMFVAIKGYESDGHKFIASAAEKGASCVLCSEKPDTEIPYILVSDSRRALAIVSANFFDNPADKMTMIGVTGTNGKTTTTNLIKTLLEKTLGAKVGLIGTNRNMIGEDEYPAERTTPDAYELQKLFARMAAEGCTHVVMEVSSHSLYLDRVYGIKFAVGAFTNLTEDHLDFHKTMDAYAEAKAILFENSACSVINTDDEYADIMRQHAAGEVFTYAANDGAADLSAQDIRYSAEGIDFCALAFTSIARVHLGIPGKFSVYNALTAMSVVMKLGVSLADAAAALKTAKGVMGRAEVVPTGKNFTVLIDYAHTPDALENIITTIKGFKKGRLVLLFGCGGDREREKRPKMGKIASEKADYVIVTSDNPRTEEPQAIIDEIMSGVKPGKSRVKVICDRREAIGYALKIAKQDDVILLAGKGHETYQIIGKEKYPFDEREVVASFLNK